ncbi:histone H4 transcription factor-like [Panonychus citri]|uniref:histone H4 transcription factor-like n=1 Tax=Panonychus citri TaxID=50023 RepID=UPI00230822DE|nr:histone H4 transcription factor-like [Panonychus citri]
MKAISEDLGKQVTCGIDGSTRTILPDLPNIFVCVWKDCPETFYRAEDFYQHVEKHPFEPTDPSTSADDDQGSNEESSPDDRALVPFGYVTDPDPSSFLDADGGEGPSFLSKDQFKCYWSDCSFISDSNSHIAQHLRSHTQEKIIACPICGGMFSNKGKFRDHLLRQLDDEDCI